MDLGASIITSCDDDNNPPDLPNAQGRRQQQRPSPGTSRLRSRLSLAGPKRSLSVTVPVHPHVHIEPGPASATPPTAASSFNPTRQNSHSFGLNFLTIPRSNNNINNSKSPSDVDSSNRSHLSSHTPPSVSALKSNWLGSDLPPMRSPVGDHDGFQFLTSTTPDSTHHLRSGSISNHEPRLLGAGIDFVRDPDAATIRSRNSRVSATSLRPQSALSRVSQRPESQTSKHSHKSKLPQDDAAGSDGDYYVNPKTGAGFFIEDEPSKGERYMENAVESMKYLLAVDVQDLTTDVVTSADSDDGNNTPDSRPLWLVNLSNVMKDRKGSRLGRIVNTFFLTVLLLSIVSFCLGTMQYFAFHPVWKVMIFGVDAFSVVIFTIEYILRVIVMESWSELWSPLMIIDLVSVLPFYIELGVAARLGGDIVGRITSVEGISALRTLRLVRTFRILKFVRKSAKLAIILQAVKSSVDGIAVLFVTVSILVVFYSSLLYYSEQYVMNYDEDRKVWIYADGVVSPYQSIPECFYYLVGSLTGNPPEVPISPFSKLVIAFCMMTSVFILAFPLTIITISYGKTIRAFTQAQKQKRERKERERAERLAQLEERMAAREYAEAEAERRKEEEKEAELASLEELTTRVDIKEEGMDSVKVEDTTPEGVEKTDLTKNVNSNAMPLSVDSTASLETLTNTVVDLPTIVATPASNAPSPIVPMNSIAALPINSSLAPPSMLLSPTLASNPSNTRTPRISISAFSAVAAAGLANLSSPPPVNPSATTPSEVKPSPVQQPTGNVRSSVNVLSAVNALKKPLRKPKPKPAPKLKQSTSMPSSALTLTSTESIASPTSTAKLVKTRGGNVNVPELFATVTPLITPGRAAPKDVELRIMDWTYVRPAPSANRSDTMSTTAAAPNAPSAPLVQATSTPPEEASSSSSDGIEDSDNFDKESSSSASGSSDDAGAMMGRRGIAIGRKKKKKKKKVVVVPPDAPDRLSLRIVVRDAEHFGRIMKALAEVT